MTSIITVGNVFRGIISITKIIIYSVIIGIILGVFLLYVKEEIMILQKGYNNLMLYQNGELSIRGTIDIYKYIISCRYNTLNITLINKPIHDIVTILVNSSALRQCYYNFASI